MVKRLPNPEAKTKYKMIKMQNNNYAIVMISYFLPKKSVKKKRKNKILKKIKIRKTNGVKQAKCKIIKISSIKRRKL